MSALTNKPGSIENDVLLNALDRARVLVCAGTGGVGKTTISAALAVRAAERGRRTLVLTIDPARRLADALGLASLTSEPTRVELDPDNEQNTSRESGTLHAMMLDPKPTFDALVHRLTEDPAARTRILENRIYRHLSEALAGSAEYAAMEQVREAVESGNYDLVIVDTPPATHALDFLAAPRRLREFLDGRFVAALIRPAMSASRFGFRVLGQSLHKMMGLVERIAGVGFLDDISEFLSAIDGLTEGFREGTARVEEILLGESTRYVLIGGSRAAFEPGALEFLDALEELEVQLAGVILNRVAPWPSQRPVERVLDEASVAALARDAEKLADALSAPPESEDEASAARDADALLRLTCEAARARADADASRDFLDKRIAPLGLRSRLVAEQAQEVDRLEGLKRIAEELVGSEPNGH